MKATRRHDLKENVLAHDLVRAREFFSKYSSWVFGALLAVVIVIAVAIYAKNRRITARQEQWDRFWVLTNSGDLDPKTREGLRALASETSQPDLAAWVQVAIGRSAYQEMRARRYDADAATMRQLATEADAAFQKVLAGHGDNVAAVAQAKLALAMMLENEREFQAATEQYESLAALGPKGADQAAFQARQRLTGIGEYARPVMFPASAPASETQPARATQPAEPSPTTLPATRP